jgi:hypothetical protein
MHDNLSYALQIDETSTSDSDVQRLPSFTDTLTSTADTFASTTTPPVDPPTPTESSTNTPDNQPIPEEQPAVADQPAPPVLLCHCFMGCLVVVGVCILGAAVVIGIPAGFVFASMNLHQRVLDHDASRCITSREAHPIQSGLPDGDNQWILWCIAPRASWSVPGACNQTCETFLVPPPPGEVDRVLYRSQEGECCFKADPDWQNGRAFFWSVIGLILYGCLICCCFSRAGGSCK